MTEHAETDVTAQNALDAVLPRRDPRYGPALIYLSAYLSTDPATRRLAMRALKAKGIEATNGKEGASE